MKKFNLITVAVALFVTMGSCFSMSNKEIVTAFYEAAINNKDYVTAEKYMGSYYKQHNPLAEDDYVLRVS